MTVDRTVTEWGAFSSRGRQLGVWYDTHGFTDERVVAAVDRWYSDDTVIRRRTVRTVTDGWVDVPRRPADD